MAIREHAPRTPAQNPNDEIPVPKRGRKVPYITLGMIGVPVAAIAGVGLWASSGSGDQPPTTPDRNSKPAAEGQAVPGVHNGSSGSSSQELPGPGEVPRSVVLHTDTSIQTPDVSQLEAYNGTTHEFRESQPGEQFEQYPAAVRAADEALAMNKYLTTGWESMQKYANLTEEEKAVLYMPDLNKPRSEWSDQDYLNYETIAIWLASVQPDRQQAIRSLSAVLDTNTVAFGAVSRHIENNPGIGYKSINRAVESPFSSVNLKNIQIGNTSIDSNGGHIAGYIPVGYSNASLGYELFKNFEGLDGNSIPMMMHKYDSLSDSDLAALLSDQ